MEYLNGTEAIPVSVNANSTTFGKFPIDEKIFGQLGQTKLSYICMID